MTFPARAVALALVLLSAAPVAAAETTLRLAPSHAPAGGSVGVLLRSDCKLNYLNLTYSRRDGSAATSTTLTDATFDESLQRYRYEGRLAVPRDAAPGGASAYVQPYCGPPSEYPPSRNVPFTVDRPGPGVSPSVASSGATSAPTTLPTSAPPPPSPSPDATLTGLATVSVPPLAPSANPKPASESRPLFAVAAAVAALGGAVAAAWLTRKRS